MKPLTASPRRRDSQTASRMDSRARRDQGGQRGTMPSRRPRAGLNDGSDFIYLQYTSGSTRTPAGVMVSSKNVFANFEPIMSDALGEIRKPDGW